jgi:hypothetical protein
MGIIVLFVALLPELGPGARFLYKLEVPGPTAEAFQPRIHDTAAVLWKIYLALTAIESALLMLAGLDLYDALTHTFSTMSTGGFSPRNASVGAFDSPLVQIIIIVFMVLAGTNFSLFFGLRQRRRWNLYRDPEFRLYLHILAGTSLLLIWDLLRTGAYDKPLRAMLDAVFQTVSITTTTGFATADFDAWPVLGRMLLVGLMFVGGCAGSTAGSMKVMRMVIGLQPQHRDLGLCRRQGCTRLGGAQRRRFLHPLSQHLGGRHAAARRLGTRPGDLCHRLGRHHRQHRTGIGGRGADRELRLLRLLGQRFDDPADVAGAVGDLFDRGDLYTGVLADVRKGHRGLRA